MFSDFFTELENKIDALIATLENVRQENSRLKQELEQNSGRMSEMEAENARLNSEMETLRTDLQGNSEKVNSAAERIQGLLARLETVQQ